MSKINAVCVEMRSMMIFEMFWTYLMGFYIVSNNINAIIILKDTKHVAMKNKFFPPKYAFYKRNVPARVRKNDFNTEKMVRNFQNYIIRYSIHYHDLRAHIRAYTSGNNKIKCPKTANFPLSGGFTKNTPLQTTFGRLKGGYS